MLAPHSLGPKRQNLWPSPRYSIENGRTCLWSMVLHLTFRRISFVVTFCHALDNVLFTINYYSSSFAAWYCMLVFWLSQRRSACEASVWNWTVMLVVVTEKRTLKKCSRTCSTHLQIYRIAGIMEIWWNMYVFACQVKRKKKRQIRSKMVQVDEVSFHKV